MKWLWFTFIAGAALAQDIRFTNTVATFTNLQSVVYSNVTLVRADLDGVVWRDAEGGGRVSYTNLSAAFLEAWGIPTNRIGIAKARAERKAVSDALYQARSLAAAQARHDNQVSRRTAKAAEDAVNAKEAEKQSALQQIQVLASQIEAEQDRLEHLEAAVSDRNMLRTDGGFDFVPATAWQKLKDARKQLQNLIDAYRRKYSTH